ncbi:CinA family protein [Cupriavidus sp. AU9028]|uniref:CinA family protein n=1 Tax=Cupriavidus sp. AU9028 TaxID=2871157 RepID=UPI001C97981C|nr:CinA family protein [Cupriavidus sp. AU9028]MBY4896071.1 CinA family protein [Cupriavidus sp. AU9028]
MQTTKEAAQFLLRHGLQLATAESCTAGLIAARIADIPGCGDGLRCAVVAYAPSIKEGVLGVPRETIKRYGLTSEEVSLAMARGVMRIAQANLAIGNTGLADGRGDDKTPAGTQCFAWIFRRAGGETFEFTETVRFHGDRNSVRESAAEFALGRIAHYYEKSLRHAAA